ncbi:PLD nuclease N-terminal domain-containing protein [Evansella tamaricis]|uniref:PLD nuclease N-terminal domain-containing protein n=1 Tax=Evansella tamaricis TaxID=2069301 RepID=A0ABS6JBT6_9BACI|nr:PLD nuclease N-terminal domain-containing protein [Evansella tamaricis]MBU9711126.1 PLD nuclease N-terminal domain-containing protein [Evansella tamaricis]
MEEILNELQSVRWDLLAPIAIVSFVLMIVAMVDCFKHGKTNGPQWVWILVIVFVNLIGPILYFIFGRRSE